MRTKLQTLQLAGYKSYNNDLEANTVRFDDINIIIGANGAGKSNLISFLEMISYLATGGLSKYVARYGQANSLLYFGSKETEEIVGKIKLADEEGKKEDVYEFHLQPTVNNQMFFAKESFQYFDLNNMHIAPYTRELPGGSSESGLITLAERNETAKVLLRYLQSYKVFHFNDTSINSKIRGAVYINDCDYLRSDAGNLAAFLLRLKNEPQFSPYYKRIVRIVKSIFPQLDDFVLHPNAENSQYITLNWKTSNSDEVFGVHQLSDGTLRFIALATLLLQPPDTAPIAFILDEPEIGLHPYAISALARMVRTASNTAQVIISTQSPALLNEFSCNQIIVAEYDVHERRTSLNRVSSEKLADWLKNYSMGELWEKNVLGGLPL